MNKLLVIILFLTIVFALNSITTDEVLTILKTDYQELLNQAMADFEAEDYDSYHEKLITYWQRNKEDQTVLIYLADYYAYIGEPELSVRFLKMLYNYGYRYFDFVSGESFDNIRDNDIFKEAWEDISERLENEPLWQGETHFITMESKLRYHVVLPKNYDPKKKYIAMIGMHGYRGNAKNYATLSRYLTDDDIIFIVPQAAYVYHGQNGKNNMFTWTLYNEEGVPEDIIVESAKLSCEYMVKLSKEIRKKYNISKLYLSGFSQGAYFSFLTGLFHSKHFDGVIMFAGCLDDITDKELKAAKKLPVLLIHGESDTFWSFENAQDDYQVLKDHGYNVELFSFDGGHTVTKEGIEKAVQWMKSKK